MRGAQRGSFEVSQAFHSFVSKSNLNRHGFAYFVNLCVADYNGLIASVCCREMVFLCYKSIQVCYQTLPFFDKLRMCISLQ